MQVKLGLFMASLDVISTAIMSSSLSPVASNLHFTFMFMWYRGLLVR
jgi:hypothetical protein